MAMAAFDGLINLDMIRITRNGVYDRTTFQGNLTRYKATERLLERIDQIEGHPAIYLKPNLDAETIILRNEVDGKKVAVDYEENREEQIIRVFYNSRFHNEKEIYAELEKINDGQFKVGTTKSESLNNPL